MVILPFMNDDCKNEVSVSQRGVTLLPGDIPQCLETYLVVTLYSGVATGIDRVVVRKYAKPK